MRRAENVQSVRRSGLLFFHCYGDGAGSGQAHLVALDAGDQPAVDVVMMSLVRAFAAVLLGST
jgi:hypothetical protein